MHTCAHTKGVGECNGSGPHRAPADREDGGLPVLPELAACFAAAADRVAPEPVGGSADLRTAACEYWSRRGLWDRPRAHRGRPRRRAAAARAARLGPRRRRPAAPPLRR
ncbi:conserved hypothetical protein, partial [Streptomyces himastatinicus ATCC 53653]